ncbi:MAG: glycosyltransferase [Elusimicrobia bacterium]|nr:glycosyltransferase [Elusimicrobiota bacterium]
MTPTTAAPLEGSERARPAVLPAHRPAAKEIATSLVIGRGWSRRARPAALLSHDAHEARVRCSGALEPGTRVRVRLSVPSSFGPAYQKLTCELPAVATKVRARSKGCEAALRWLRPLPELVADAEARRRRRIGLLLLAVLLLTLGQRWSALRYFWYDPVFEIYSVIIGLYFFSRFYFAAVHRPPEDKGYEPTVSVIISVRNEEDGIAEAISSCFSAEYPDEKREVIVVDDGSTDGTPREIARMLALFPGLKSYRLPPQGKRFAMAEGIREATGEIVVMVDSDTQLDRMALRQIVRGFEDPGLGAASGFTSAANADKNMLTRMQDLRYLVSYELMKAPESVFGCVSCCPGCLSAYRRAYLLPILDTWLNQTFLGRRATFGDDRSLTNHILRDYRVIYNPLALSTTLVPENWMHYLRQQCRWKKSWVREFPIAGRILLRRHPVAALSFFASAVCSLVSPIMVIRYVWWGKSDLLQYYLLGMVFFGLLTGLFALWRRPIRYWYLSWVWILTQTVFMGPQTYYAMLTLRRNHWGTR